MFNVGDQATCTGSQGYNFTEGKTYTILKYEPEWFDTSVSGGFTWPAYVTVKDDSGRKAHCHAHRFKPVQ